MARRSILLALAATAISMAVAVPPASAFHAWESYHWSKPSSAELALDIGDNLTTAQWKSMLATSNNDWNESSVLANRLVTGRAGGNCKAVSGTVQVCNGAYGQNGWLGLAQIWLSNGHIVQGVAKMNDTYFAMDRYNNIGERQHVLCQEVGHTFGLGHTSEDGSSQDTCMDYYKNTSDEDLTSTKPNPHDYEELATIYSHTHEAAPASTKPGKGNQRANGDNVFVKDLPNGQTRVTFIYWADGHGDERQHHDDH